MNLRTGSGIKNASTSSGWITKSPLGLRQSNATFAKDLLGATSADAFKFSSWWDLFTNRACNKRGSWQAGLVFCNVQVRLVQRQWLDEVRVALENLLHAVRDRAVACEVRRGKNSSGAHEFCLYCWHGRVHAESPGLIGSGTHDGPCCPAKRQSRGLPRSCGSSRCLTEAQKASMSQWDNFSHNHVGTMTNFRAAAGKKTSRVGLRTWPIESIPRK
jgi:hypothetical protein